MTQPSRSGTLRQIVRSIHNIEDALLLLAVQHRDGDATELEPDHRTEGKRHIRTPKPPFLNADAAAARIGVVKTTLYEYLTRAVDPLPGTKAGGWRIHVEQLDEWMKRQAMKR